MMLLTNGMGEPLIINLDDDSEIEIEIVELEGGKTNVVIYSDEKVSMTHKFINKNW